jgi:Tol biopolymer transport system component
MVRRNLPSLGGSLTIAILVVGACSGGGSPTVSASGGGAASPTAPTATTVQVTPATATSTPATTAAASATGTHNGRIAFGVRAADGTANIFSVLPDGTDERQLTTGPGNHLCAAYAADGNQIAYCADTGGHFEIWTMKPDGTKQTQLTHLGGRALFPDFSRDGKKVAFGGVQGDDPNTEIYAVDATTGEGLVALTSCAGLAHGCSNDYPAWSPDGRSIVFIHTDDFDASENPVNAQVWVMNADGSNKRALTTDTPMKDQVPDWSPDGSLIAYASGAADSEGIWVMNADGSKPHQVSGCLPSEAAPCKAGNDFGPAWSPDGTGIAFLRAFQAVGKADRPIFTMDADGSHQVRVSQETILAAVPAWQGSAAGQAD